MKPSRQIFALLLGVFVALGMSPAPVQASAAAVGRVALEHLKRDGAREYSLVEPCYLRKPEAELNRNKVKGKRLKGT